jgi:FkbM family methyltransferase
MSDFIYVLTNYINNNKIKFKKDKFIIFDIGAHQGTFSHELNNKINLKKKLHFYLFDPLKRYVNFESQSIDNFNYYELAFDSSKKSYKKFYLNNYFHASGSSLKGFSFKDKKYRISRTLIASLIYPFKSMVKVINVKTDNLNDFFKKNYITHINVLKIDTEGTELDVISGAIKILKKIDIICVEIQTSKNTFKSRERKINKILNKDFKLLYRKRIIVASILTGIISYDCIYIRK